MRALAAFSLSLVFQISGVSAQPLGDHSQKLTYPQTARVSATEERFGQTLADPYRWLENPASRDNAVAGWIKAQNSITRTHLDSLPGREVLRKRMTELLDYDQFTAPRKRGNRYFFMRYEGLSEQTSLYMRDGVSGDAREIIDPASGSQDKAGMLAQWDTSDDGLFVAFSIQRSGTDLRTIRVLDVNNGRNLEDVFEPARYASIAWATDGSGFFYTRMPETAGEGSASSPTADHAVYFHRLGTEQAEDRVLYSMPDRPGLRLRVARVSGGRYLSISSAQGPFEDTMALIDLTSTDWKPRVIFAGTEFQWSILGSDEDKLILVTTEAADRGRVISLDLSEPNPEPVQIVAEAADNAVLDTAVVAGDSLLIGYRIDVQTEIRRFTRSGKPDGKISMPGIGSARWLEGSSDADEAFFVFTSFNAPTSIYRYDTATKAVTPWAVPKVNIDLDKIAFEQRFYRSKDGTNVPLFIVRRKDVTSAAPTLLYNYSGFGVSQIPFFNPRQLAWVEQGGVLAIPNVRGGGEYGRAWHRAGQLGARQTAFDDFIAAAEFLKETGVTSAHGLAIQGEWAGGGLLVGAVVNQRPDLVDVALPHAGAMDMLRYDKLAGGTLWTREYGSPTEERHFLSLMRYSPYHNIAEGKDYPAILATTDDIDQRFAPAHTLKYVAALQAAELGPKPRLALVAARKGQADNPLEQLVDRYADMWAFAAYWTGLKVEQTK